MPPEKTELAPESETPAAQPAPEVQEAGVAEEEPSVPHEAPAEADGESGADGSTAQLPVIEPLEEKSEPLTAPPPPPQAEVAASIPAGAPHPTNISLRSLLKRARETLQFRKRKKLDRILQALESQPAITNDQVEKLLRVSDATATRYLSQLEREGRVRQIGKTGRYVTYTLT